MVGQRVVVRRVLRGETGPSGGPAMTDLLGVCTAWTGGADGLCVVQPETGEAVRIPLADIVSGKPVPPRPSVRHRVEPRAAQHHGFALFDDLETAPLGSWTLRRSAAHRARRANSCLAFGPSGLDGDAELQAVLAHYERPVVAVLSGSPEAERFLALGWRPESGDADTVFMIAGTSRALRASRRGLSSPDDDPRLEESRGPRGASAVVRVGSAASGVAACDGDWVGFRSIDVAPEHRRRGLALAVMESLLDWGAEQGATTAYLQVLADNAPALALYERLGFTEHHRYRYLVAPSRG
ncbi:GNAT family N-acetyltransferase [Nocardioides nanhaiensis]|uniref:GNAT family N-acetyltransferase n=1 Tax=Nocardioides nanhaiensis TaxID=1476871 RepID=A0ABP8X2W7_9ACTN